MADERSGDWRPRWRAEVLRAAPMIRPARQFTYPLQVPGEEDAMARGALEVMVHPAEGGSFVPFLATCALGFTSGAVPTGVFACPNPGEICLVAGGYGYVVDTEAPERCVQVPLRPVVEVRAVEELGVLVFVGFHTVVGWAVEGMAWETRRLSWEGVRVTGVEAGSLRGFGWDLRTDKEIAFSVDLKTGEAVGGAF